MKLTNGWGQEIKPEWTRGKLTLETIHSNLHGLQRLDVSKSFAAKVSGMRVPRCGYEVVVMRTRIHEGHDKTTYLTNVSDSRFYFWSYEPPCNCIPMAK